MNIRVEIEPLPDDRYRIRRYWPSGDVETDLFTVDDLAEAWQCAINTKPPAKIFRRKRSAFFAALKIWTQIYHMVLEHRGECTCDKIREERARGVAE